MSGTQADHTNDTPDVPSHVLGGGATRDKFIEDQTKNALIPMRKVVVDQFPNPASYTVRTVAGKPKQLKIQNTLEKRKKMLQGILDSAKDIKIHKQSQLPWEEDKECKLLNTEKEKLTYKINYLRTRLGLLPIHKDVTKSYDIDMFTDTRKNVKPPVHYKNEHDNAAWKELIHLETELSVIEKEERFRKKLIKFIEGTAPGEDYLDCPWVPKAIREDHTKEINYIYDEKTGKHNPRSMINYNPNALRGIVKAEDDLELKKTYFLKLLRHKKPETDEEAFLWYKYLIKGIPLEGVEGRNLGPLSGIGPQQTVGNMTLPEFESALKEARLRQEKAEKEKTKAEQEKEKIKKEKDEVENIKKELEKNLKGMKKELNMKDDEIKATLDKVKELSEKLGLSDKQVKELATDNLKLQSQIKGFNGDKSSYDELVKGFEQELAEKTEEIKRNGVKAEEFRRHIAKLQLNEKFLNETSESYQRQIDTLMDQLNKTGGNAAKIHSLGEESSKKDSIIKQQKATIAEHEKTISKQKATIGKHEETIRDHANMIISLNDAKKKIETANKTLEEKNEELLKATSEGEKERIELKRQLDETVNKLNNALQSSEAFEAKIKELEDMVRKNVQLYNDELGGQIADKANIQNELNQLKLQMEDLKNDYNLKLQEIQQLQQNYGMLNGDAQNAVQQWKQNDASQKLLIQRLQNEIMQYKTIIDSMPSPYEEVDMDINPYEGEHEGEHGAAPKKDIQQQMALQPGQVPQLAQPGQQVQPNDIILGVNDFYFDPEKKQLHFPQHLDFMKDDLTYIFHKEHDLNNAKNQGLAINWWYFLMDDYVKKHNGELVFDEEYQAQSKAWRDDALKKGWAPYFYDKFHDKITQRFLDLTDFHNAEDEDKMEQQGKKLEQHIESAGKTGEIINKKAAQFMDYVKNIPQSKDPVGAVLWRQAAADIAGLVHSFKNDPDLTNVKDRISATAKHVAEGIVAGRLPEGPYENISVAIMKADLTSQTEQEYNEKLKEKEAARLFKQELYRRKKELKEGLSQTQIPTSSLNRQRTVMPDTMFSNTAPTASKKPPPKIIQGTKQAQPAPIPPKTYTLQRGGTQVYNAPTKLPIPTSRKR